MGRFGRLACGPVCVVLALSIVLSVAPFESAQSVGARPIHNALHPKTHGSDADTNSIAILAIRFKQVKSKKLEQLPIGERVAAIGKLFLGTPYVAGTLDRSPEKETLVVDLRGFDCVTFYENSLAIARASTAKTFEEFERSFKRQLELIRYRRGVRDGYHSRLHYTTDYFADADAKHVLRLVTCEIGKATTVLDTNVIDFMSTHRASYAALAKNDSEFELIKQMEKNLNARGGFVYIPKDSIAKVEGGIQTGDILGITTDIPGLDCTHTGIAVREQTGRIHFMHASSLMHKVIVTEEPLVEYLEHNKRQMGIIVMRPLAVSQSNK